MARLKTPRILFDQLVAVSQKHVRRKAQEFAKNKCPNPMTDPEDLEQEVWTRLWAWLQKKPNWKTAKRLLRSGNEAVRWMQQFARARMCDWLDLWFVESRDARKTLHASEGRTSEGDQDASLLESLARDEDNPTDHGTWDHAIGAVWNRCHTNLGRRLTWLLTHPPAYVREAFWQSRLETLEGSCRMFWPEHRSNPDLWDRTRLLLFDGRGDNPDGEDVYQEIHWDGPPHTGDYEMRKRFNTTVGSARARWERNQMRVDFGCGLSVLLNISGRLYGRKSIRGTYVWEHVKPSPRVMDTKAVAEYLGVPQTKVKEAWKEVEFALSVS